MIPQTTLHLRTEPVESAGGIEDYRWSVTQPMGSLSTLRPSADAPAPSFEVNVVGVYTVTLDATSHGVACPGLTATVYVVSHTALHIELTWVTPGDPDELDAGWAAGSDLDLHLLHPNGSGWFDAHWDAYAHSQSPAWDASLDRDDTDGAGPENMNLAELEPGACYRIGVHYWDDYDYGPAYAVVRVYLSGNLMLQTDDVKLVDSDLWSVGRVCEGGAPELDDCDGPCITPDYPLPF